MQWYGNVKFLDHWNDQITEMIKSLKWSNHWNDQITEMIKSLKWSKQSPYGKYCYCTQKYNLFWGFQVHFESFQAVIKMTHWNSCFWNSGIIIIIILVWWHCHRVRAYKMKYEHKNASQVRLYYTHPFPQGVFPPDIASSQCSICQGVTPLWCLSTPLVFIDPHWFSQKYIKNTLLTPPLVLPQIKYYLIHTHLKSHTWLQFNHHGLDKWTLTNECFISSVKKNKFFVCFHRLGE